MNPTDADDQDWSAPSLYSRDAQPMEPRTFTEADPLGALLVDTRLAEENVRWGPVTYGGRRRRRPPKHPAVPPVHSDVGDAPNDATATAATAAAAQDDARAATSTATSTDTSTGLASEVPPDDGNRRLLANSRSMAVASLASRITGFLRSILIVAALGREAVGNAYNAANTFPNMVYELLLGGVLSSVLIPLLVHAEESDEDGGVSYTQRLLSLATAALGVLTLVAVAAAPLITGVFVPAGPQRDLATVWATILLPEIFFYGLGAMFMAVLNIRHSYAPGAWAPVLNNMIMIATVVVFWALPGPATLDPATMTTAQVIVIGVGTTLGIAAQAFVLVPYLRRTGFHWRWRFRALPHEVGRMREVGTLAGWVFAYVVASQMGVSVIQYVGQHDGGYTVFTNVDLLFQVPYGILVVSLLTAIMPRMSRAAVRGDDETVKEDLRLGGRLSAVTMVPITGGLIALGVPLCVTLFAHGKASIADGGLFGSALAMSAFGLFPFAIVMLQLRVFYAMRDGRTPALINVCMVVTKVVLVFVTDAIYTVPHGVDPNRRPNVHAVEWLNIATSASYVVGAVVGHVLLTRRLGLLGFRAVLLAVLRVAAATTVGAALAYLVVVGCRHAISSASLASLAGLVGGGVVGLAVFAAVAWRMRIPEVRDLAGLVRGG